MKLLKAYSDLSTFKQIKLKDGLNILLSEKSPDSTDKKTRNRAGKTSFIEMIHFILGESAKTDNLFRSKELEEYNFGYEMELASHKIDIERAGFRASKIHIVSGDTSKWAIQPTIDRKTGERLITNTNWKAVLGNLVFGLPALDDEEDSTSRTPSFRSLFPYFVRRQTSGGFIDPFRHSEDQQPGDTQVALSYLMGLDWTLPSEWQSIRDKERTLKELKKAAGNGALGSVIGSLASLRTKLILAEARLKRSTESIQSFKILPEYHSLEEEASLITKDLSELTNQDYLDRHLLSELKKTSFEEKTPEKSDLEKVYKEAGAIFTETVLKRFEDVKAFHDSVLKNRKRYLEEEITDIERRIQNRKAEMEKRDGRRSEIMLTLRSHGALDQFSRIQFEHTKLQTEVENLRKQYEAAETLEGTKTELNVERGKLLKQLQQEYHENRKSVDNVIVTFEEISSQLYERAGSLTISESLNGPVFDVEIQGARSKGISNMQIFCFDLMLMKLCCQRNIGPRFLVHDSHLFDGVDGRQIAKALMVAKDYAAKLKFQYIVTLNSDILDSIASENGLDVTDDILKPTLTDSSDSGGLFGFRF